VPSCGRFCGTTEPGWKVWLLNAAEGVCGLRPPFWRPGWKGELAALRSKWVRRRAVLIVKGGRVKVVRGRLGEDGVGLAGLPLIHDRSCAWTRWVVSLGGWRKGVVIQHAQAQTRAHDGSSDGAAHTWWQRLEE
jgi:hypothetical protein